MTDHPGSHRGKRKKKPAPKRGAGKVIGGRVSAIVRPRPNVNRPKKKPVRTRRRPTRTRGRGR